MSHKHIYQWLLLLFLCPSLMAMEDSSKRKSEDQENVENKKMKKEADKEGVVLIGHDGSQIELDASIAQLSPKIKSQMDKGITEISVDIFNIPLIEVTELQVIKLFLEIMDKPDKPDIHQLNLYNPTDDMIKRLSQHNIEI